MTNLFAWHKPLEIKALNTDAVRDSLRRGCLAASFRPRTTRVISEDISADTDQNSRRPSAWDFSHLHEAI